MKRRGFVLALAAVVGLRPSTAPGVTEVHHGPNARFAAPLTGDVFTCTVVGRHTTLRDCGAGGVTAFCFVSSNPAEQNAELLVLRTSFLEWFREMYEKTGGDRKGAFDQVVGVAQQWLQPGFSPGPCPNSPTTMNAPPRPRGRCTK